MTTATAAPQAAINGVEIPAQGMGRARAQARARARAMCAALPGQPLQRTPMGAQALA